MTPVTPAHDALPAVTETLVDFDTPRGGSVLRGVAIAIVPSLALWGILFLGLRWCWRALS